MNSKKGMSKIALVLIIVVILVIIAVATVLTIMLLSKGNTPTGEIELYEDYTEGEGFTGDEELIKVKYEPLETGLKEYRNDELGVRFGYLNNLSTPVDTLTEDGTVVSTITDEEKGKVVELRVGKIDVSQTDIDHVVKQKEALTKELIKAETKVVTEEVDGKEVKKTIVPEKVSDINVSNALFADQLAVKFTYTENGKDCARVLTIKNEYVFSLTYKAEKEEYKSYEEEKVFSSFHFIEKIDEVEKSELNTVIINEKEYTLPLKNTKMEGLQIDTKYATQKIQPNFLTIVSLYELQEPKYSAYVYNAKASVNDIGDGYVTAVSTDINRGGNLKIYKGIEIGTQYSQVQDLLGSPSRQYISEDDSTLTNIYQIEDTTIQLKFREDDLSKPGESSKVVSILLKVAI